jgi:Holliday junction resolvase
VSGSRHRRKGDRIDRELVALHKQMGVHAERYPLSGASRFRGSGHDLDVYVFSRDEAPLVAEVKARKNGAALSSAGSATTICWRFGAIMQSRLSLLRGGSGLV